jgi:hypothetical protein
MNPTRSSTRQLLLPTIAALSIAAFVTSAGATTAKDFRRLAKALAEPSAVGAHTLPVQTTGEPAHPTAIRVPGVGAAGTPICGIIAGKFQCISITSITCPSSIQLLESDSNALFDCKVSCDPPEPDDEGYCECSIRYDTCAPV